MKLYRNGSEIASRNGASRYTPRNANLQIGGRLDSSFDDLIDEFAVFNVALSENDIRMLMGGINRAFAKSVNVGKTVASPDTASVRIEVSARLPGENLHRFSFDMAFEPTILQAINIAEGTLLNHDGATTVWNTPVVDNEKGLITGITCRRTGEEAVTEGAGPLVVATFKPIRAGGSARGQYTKPALVYARRYGDCCRSTSGLGGCLSTWKHFWCGAGRRKPNTNRRCEN